MGWRDRPPADEAPGAGRDPDTAARDIRAALRAMDDSIG
jgi:hypothetical protein